MPAASGRAEAVAEVEAATAAVTHNEDAKATKATRNAPSAQHINK